MAVFSTEIILNGSQEELCMYGVFVCMHGCLEELLQVTLKIQTDEKR